MRDGAYHDVFEVLNFLLESFVVAVKNESRLVKDVSSLEEKLKMNLFSIKINDR